MRAKGGNVVSAVLRGYVRISLRHRLLDGAEQVLIPVSAQCPTSASARAAPRSQSAESPGSNGNRVGVTSIPAMRSEPRLLVACRFTQRLDFLDDGRGMRQ